MQANGNWGDENDGAERAEGTEGAERTERAAEETGSDGTAESGGAPGPEGTAGSDDAEDVEREDLKAEDVASERMSGVLELPRTKTWAAMEDELRAIGEELKREEDEAARIAAENEKLIPLRLERLAKKQAAAAELLSSPERTERAMFSGGNARMWSVRQAMTSATRSRDAAAEQRDYAADVVEFGETEAEAREDEREALANASVWREQPPLWQQICGFTPAEELGVHPNVRAAGLRRLIKRAEWLIRWEIRRAETERNGAMDRDGEIDRDGEGANAGDGDEGRVDSLRRTAQWDPLREICLYLGIAQRKLSALCREVNGMAVTQLSDAIRGESLRKKMRTRILEWVAGQKETAGRGDGGSLVDRAWALWRTLRAERQKSGSHRSSFAWEIGFSSYTRMFRACLVCYGLAPQELEVLLIKESLGGGATCVFGQAGGGEVKIEAEAEENSGKPAEAG